MSVSVLICSLCLLQELYCAIQLNAEVIMCLSSAQAKELYQRLKQEQRQQQAGGVAKQKQEALVPTIDVRKAQATKENDRVRIFTKIEDTIGIKAFNAQLQAFMEAALQEEARAALLSAAAGSMHGREGRVTLGMVHEEIKGVRQGLATQREAMAQQEQAMATQREAMAKQQEETKAHREGMAKQQDALKAEMLVLGEKLDAVLARL
jgi:hypothetical protein